MSVWGNFLTSSGCFWDIRRGMYPDLFENKRTEFFVFRPIGRWYGDLHEALRVFAQYDHAREYVIHMAGRGRTIRELVA